MSVTMMLRVKADPKVLQEVINGNEPRVQAINARAKELGATHHRFMASADGTEIVVIDEWESAEAFQKFFEASPEIRQIMAETGVTSEPEITFWHELDTVDRFWPPAARAFTPSPSARRTPRRTPRCGGRRRRPSWPATSAPCCETAS